MAAVVIDASAIVELFVGRRPDARLRRRSLVDSLVAPEIADCEVLNVLRRLERKGQLAPEHAERAVLGLCDAPIIRVTHRPLVLRTWALRHSTNSYDGAYVALAEQLDVPLITCDGRLGKSHGHEARIEYYPGTAVQ